MRRRACRCSSTASRSACAIWASALPMTSWCPPASTKPMQLHIQHRTTYRYEEPVKYTAQTLRLTPRREGQQRTLSWSIRAPGRRTEQLDAHGNITHLLTLEEPHREYRDRRARCGRDDGRGGLPALRRDAVAACLSRTDAAHRRQCADELAGARTTSVPPARCASGCLTSLPQSCEARALRAGHDQRRGLGGGRLRARRGCVPGPGARLHRLLPSGRHPGALCERLPVQRR